MKRMAGTRLQRADNILDVLFVPKTPQMYVLIFRHNEYITKWKHGNTERNREPGLHYKDEPGIGSWGILYCNKATKKSHI
jgi:hypothetical protein